VSSSWQLSGLEILLVEDEPLIGMMISEWLEENGASAHWVPTDSEAYRLLEGEDCKVDVLITDINLRFGTTGFDVARFARKMNARLPVIYLSGELAEPDAAPDWSVEGALFLTKPIRPGQLIDAIKKSCATSSINERQTIRASCPGG